MSRVIEQVGDELQPCTLGQRHSALRTVPKTTKNQGHFQGPSSGLFSYFKMDTLL